MNRSIMLKESIELPSSKGSFLPGKALFRILGPLLAPIIGKAIDYIR